MDENRSQAYLELIQSLLNSPSGEEAQILQANLDKLDDGLTQILQAWAIQTLAKVEPEQAQSIATILFRFGNLIGQFTLGNRASNLEEDAIASYKNALQIYTSEAFPFEWATIQNNLAIAYHERIRGEKADNLEDAIASCQNALEIYTREAFPFEWAAAQNNLANAYRNRIRGEKADNLEDAIASYQNALQIYTREAFPFQWATIQNNLATAYRERNQR
ncbi:MAG: tetratricopeptide repeat protein [Symploca sp. SIO2G7]|nr:tetratricopeptide repeat protein [Symploca sp. SIO2G7]